MEKEPKMGIDPKIKEEINKESWEGDAAVLIGKKEEMPQLEKRLIEQGRAENLGTYIKMHKEIVVPKEEISEMGQANLSPGLAIFHGGDTLYYIDKEGNIARVEIEHEKITPFREELGPSSTIRELLNGIKELGFDFSQSPSPVWFDVVSKEIGNYRKKLEKEMKDRKKEEFDF